MLKGKFRFVAGLLTGALLGGTVMTSVGAQVEKIESDADDKAVEALSAPAPIERKRLINYLTAVENVLVSLSVDTERSAIGIAELDGRIRKIERRLVTLEERVPDKPSRDR